MTLLERKHYSTVFPKLNVDNAIVTAEESSRYNCIAWTLGITDRWVWPLDGDTLGDFDGLYGQYGYKRSPEESGSIAVFGIDQSRVTHGCILTKRPLWESKLGASIRIRHRLRELESLDYGTVIAFYNREKTLSEDAGAYVEGVVDRRRHDLATVHKQMTTVLDSAVSSIDRRTVEEFERRYASWEKSCKGFRVWIQSNPAARKKNKEFGELVEMGEQVIPLVVQKLMSTDNFFALQVYEELQPDKALHVKDQSAQFEGEQMRAKRTAERWLAQF